MRTGLLIPIGNNALAIAFIVAIIFTIIWLIYHATIHTNKNQLESNFNKSSLQSDHLDFKSTNDINEFFLKFPNRNVSLDAGTTIFWTSGNPISISIAQANTQSPLKVYVRVKASARELGHKITIGNSDENSISLNLTSESLIFSNDEKSFYPIYIEDLKKLKEILRRQESYINKIIKIPQNDAENISDWVEKIIQIQANNTHILLIGE